MIRFVLISLFESLWCLSNLIVKPRRLNYQKGLQREFSSRNIDAEAYHKRKKKYFKITSDYGYKLSCEFIEGEELVEKKIVIFCHGFGYARYGCIKYIDFFLRMGYSVLMYDHRNHGESGKAHTSMGFYERYDLVRVVDWCYETFGADCKVITHGESMGAATVLLHLGIDSRVKCAIADCAYSDLTELLRHQLKQFYHLPGCLIPVVSHLTYLRAGFYYRQVSPIMAVRKTETPILFIHGKIDNMVPCQMSRKMYYVKKDKKAIYLVAKARHAASYLTNKEGYEKRVEDFLKKYVK